MTLNNIDTQFAVTRSEIKAMIGHVETLTDVGHKAATALFAMIDTLDDMQNDSYQHTESFHRCRVIRDFKQSSLPITPEDETFNVTLYNSQD